MYYIFIRKTNGLWEMVGNSTRREIAEACAIYDRLEGHRVMVVKGDKAA